MLKKWQLATAKLNINNIASFDKCELSPVIDLFQPHYSRPQKHENNQLKNNDKK
ncbi:TPA: hypothetical protein ACSP0J_001577 [Aeromonas veronii]